jgi:hypothetical protein
VARLAVSGIATITDRVVQASLKPPGEFGKRSEETARSKNRNRASDRRHNGRRPHRALQLQPPDHPIADVTTERVKRRPVLGGLVNQYERTD